MHVGLGAPQLTPVADGAVADDPVAVTNDTSVPLKVDARPLVLQIRRRKGGRGLRVERQLERGDDLGHPSSVHRDSRSEDEPLHTSARYGKHVRSRPPSGSAKRLIDLTGVGVVRCSTSCKTQAGWFC